MRGRWAAYAGVSVALASGVVLKALYQRPNFYSAAVYLAASNANLMILTNLIFLTACTVLVGLQRLLYGTLRPIETEQLYEKAWFAVTETCLAMTIFRGEISGGFLVMFFSLLAAKVWGWIGEGRVEILEQQPPANPTLFHTRLAISLSLSVLFDSYVLEYLVKQVLHQARPDMMVMFGFEFAVLTILSTSTMARYAISLVEIYIVRKQKEKRIEEMRRERRAAARAAAAPANTDAAPSADATTSSAPDPAEEPINEAEVEVEGWEAKGRWVFYLDLTTDFLKLVVYLSFFFILLVFYGLPIHIMRDVFLTCRSFFKRISDFFKYRAATRDMNERYSDATVEELRREDVCIICREEMRPYPPPTEPGAAPAPPSPLTERMRPKKLPCGHILHLSCLRSWLERQQMCPTCRRPVVAAHGGLEAAGVRPGVNAAGVHQHAIEQEQAGADQPAHLPNNQPAVGQNRLRMINLGPLRIGFGAGRGNLVQELAHQIHNDQARPGFANENRHQQYGFSLGFGRLRNRRDRYRDTPIDELIEEIRARLLRERSQMNLAGAELDLYQRMEEQANTLRNARRELGRTFPLASSTTTQLPPLAAPGRPPQVFSAHSQQPVLAAGSDQLPEGLSLPPGWTMMPLQPYEGTTQPVQMGHQASTPAVFPVGWTPFPPGWAAYPHPHFIPDPAQQPPHPLEQPGSNNGVHATASNTTEESSVPVTYSGPPPHLPAQSSEPILTLPNGHTLASDDEPRISINDPQLSTPLTAAPYNTSHPSTTISNSSIPSSTLPSWGAQSDHPSPPTRLPPQPPLAAPIPSRPPPSSPPDTLLNGDSDPSMSTTEVGEPSSTSKGKARAKPASVEDVVDEVD